jgi:hypothetical protein
MTMMDALVSNCMAGMRGSFKVRTFAVVVQVSELISPLCHDAQRIFEKGNDNQEATNCWYISIPGFN